MKNRLPYSPIYTALDFVAVNIQKTMKPVKQKHRCYSHQGLWLPLVYMLAHDWLCHWNIVQWEKYLKFDQANFTASWKFCSSSSSTPLIHFISFFVSFSVSFSNSVQCAMMMLASSAAAMLTLDEPHVADWFRIELVTVLDVALALRKWWTVNTMCSKGTTATDSSPLAPSLPRCVRLRQHTCAHAPADRKF